MKLGTVNINQLMMQNRKRFYRATIIHKNKMVYNRKVKHKKDLRYENE